MPFVGPSSVRIEPRGSKVKKDRKSIEKSKSIAMALMKKQGFTFREIGSFFGVDGKTAWNRIAKLPPGEIKAHAQSFMG